MSEQANQNSSKPMTIEERLERMERALEIAFEYASIDGEWHKTWVIDQMVRALTGDNYPNWVARHNRGEDGLDTYSWDQGLAP